LQCSRVCTLSCKKFNGERAENSLREEAGKGFTIEAEERFSEDILGKIMQTAKRMASNVYTSPALTFELIAKCSVSFTQISKTYGLVTN
jgi:hypothetical protein